MKISEGRKFCLCLILITVTSKIKSRLKNENESAFSYGFSYLADVVSNLHEGIQTGPFYLGMANLTVNFDTEKAGFWKGGELFINGANTHGAEPSANLIGDFQGLSNIEVDNLTYLHEFWFKQSLKKFSFTIGLQDLNAEYAVSDLGSMFINSSFGIHSTIANNVPSPIFPLTRLELNIDWNISKSIIFKIAAFNGLRDDYQNNDFNTNRDLNTIEGSLYIGELVISKSIVKNQGTYKIGFYDHNHHILEETEETDKVEYNMAFYLVADQLIYKHPNRDGGFAMFTQLGLSNPEKNNRFAYPGVGIHYYGISNNRCNYEIGLAVAHTWFKTSRTGNETTIELNYKALLCNHVFVQPDIQYILNPSETGEPLQNTIVALFRLGLEF